MSQEKALAFLHKVQADSELQGAVRKAEYEALRKIAAKHGFEFSLEDYIAARLELGSDGGRELSDDELDQVSGGSIWPAC